MMETVTHWIAAHGYGVIFGLLALGILGLPLPNDWLLAYLGFLIYKGRLDAVPAVAAALAGTFCGMTLNYGLGRTFGLYAVRKFGGLLRITPEAVQKAHDWFEHSGRWSLLVGYYLPGVRHLTALAAGTSRMSFGEFFLFGFSGGILWCGTFITLGYYFEEHWSRESQRIHHVLLICSALVMGAAIAYVLAKKALKR